MLDIVEIINENTRRKVKLEEREGGYDPITGCGCFGSRVEIEGEFIPTSVFDEISESDWRLLDANSRDRIRARHDFEFWCARCVTIKDKISRRLVKLVLNYPQRKMVSAMEGQRMSGHPIRVVLLKARQWGGSTLVLVYMAWQQIMRHENFNSLIVGHRQMNSRVIKSMLSTLVSHYPADMQPTEGKLRLKRGDDANIFQLLPSGSNIVLGTALSEDSTRGNAFSMAHMSEVAFWKDSLYHDPRDVIRTIGGSVPMSEDTVVVMESTANGVGNLFHQEWLRASRGDSDKVGVFVPWYEIPIYRQTVGDVSELWKLFDGYERDLWKQGLTLEQIAWYHYKRREYSSHILMMSEYPTTAEEAFIATETCAFASDDIERMRANVKEPIALGEIESVDGVTFGGVKESKFIARAHGGTEIWAMPERGHRYVVSVDVGGLNVNSDWSVIAVFDTGQYSQEALPELVAQWRGHIEHKLLAWKAMRMAKFYNTALLVIESNTLDTSGTEGASGILLLNEIGYIYHNLYYRRGSNLPGFHTNKTTKCTIIFELKSHLMCGTYIERDHKCLDEFSTYQELEAGTRWEARQGCHDDILMTRAIALHVIDERCRYLVKPYDL